jgi:hypothetical protein
MDLDGTFVWPITDFPTLDRPDIIIVSMSSRTIMWGELTFPKESRMAIPALKKTRLYSKLNISLLLKDWRVHDFTFEVGSIGVLGNTVRHFLLDIGFFGGQLKALYKRMAQNSPPLFFLHLVRSSLSHLVSPVSVQSQSCRETGSDSG